MTTLYFVCPLCRTNRMAHEICCGSWPFAVDLDDLSLHSLVALLSIDAIHQVLQLPDTPSP